MPKIDVDCAPAVRGTRYPPPCDAPCRARHRLRLGEAAGLRQFGVNLLRLPPGAWSSQRHWHAGEDEFVWIVSGEVVLVTGAGEVRLAAGECAGFRAGDPDGHHLQNRSEAEAVILEVGTRTPDGDEVAYPDIDLHLPAGGSGVYRRKDGSSYEEVSAA